MKTTVTAERVMDAPAEVIYHCIADYREHHRPDGFLPPAFTNFEIRRGGVGAGTELRWDVEAGGRTRTIEATISEPRPGRTLVETGADVVTTFTVEPEGSGARVRFDTIVDDRGVQGLLSRMFAGRLLRPIYEDELRRLEAYARAHAPLS
jgi:hypothetical protein